MAVLAAQLPDHEVRIFDPNIAVDPLKNTKNSIEEYHPEVIGFSLRNVDTTKYSDQFLYFEHFRTFIKAIKDAYPRTEIIVGGSGFSLFPQRIMQLIPQINVGFYQDAELSLVSYLKQSLKGETIPGLFLRKNGKVTFTGLPEKPDLNSLNPPAWSLLNVPAYLPYSAKSSIGVETKRGCAMHCSYCTYPVISGSSVRLKDPVRVVEELSVLKKSYAVDRVFFCDPVFNYPLEHAKAVCREILRGKIEIKWSAYHQDRFLDQEYVQLAVQAGCDDFYFSPDSASPLGLKQLGKATTIQSLHQSLDLINKQGDVRASYNFFATVPETGWRNFFAAVSFLLKAKLKLKDRLSRWKLSYIRIEPATPVVERIFGERTEETDAILLPEDLKHLNRLFYRRSTSALLNVLLFLHFYWGKRSGRKNVLL